MLFSQYWTIQTLEGLQVESFHVVFCFPGDFWEKLFIGWGQRKRWEKLKRRGTRREAEEKVWGRGWGTGVLFFSYGNFIWSPQNVGAQETTKLKLKRTSTFDWYFLENIYQCACHQFDFFGHMEELQVSTHLDQGTSTGVAGVTSEWTLWRNMTWFVTGPFLLLQ